MKRALLSATGSLAVLLCFGCSASETSTNPVDGGELDAATDTANAATDGAEDGGAPPDSAQADSATAPTDASGTDARIDTGSAGGDTGNTGSDAGGSNRGFPSGAPWVSFYGTAAQMGDLAKVASTFRVINLDADPGAGNFTPAQIATLRKGGENRVISYLNVGSCEDYRDYWDSAPSGFVSCKANTTAHRGLYDGYPDETWMDVGNADYQKLIVEHVAPRLVAQGVDGFFLDNLEIVEHGTSTTNGPCNASCSQGGLDLVRKLREKYPSLLIVMQNATSNVTRLGTTGGVAFPSLLDGISHEEVYAPSVDTQAETELLAWKGMSLMPGGRPFWIATEDYVGSCSASTAAKSAYDKSRARGFSPYATDESGGQLAVCYWAF